ncbi:MAG: CPBP family intramembrane metalloprotease [Anaerolineae bacterium]|nr:CPBP family intramembrane metalloprotease [Anaerolineae bacterium]
MPEADEASVAGKSGSRLVLVIAGYVAFCGISLLSRSVYTYFGLVVLVGLALPLAWGRFTGKWAAMGFTRRNMASALLWGVGAGIVSSAAGLAVLTERSVPSNLGLQMLIGLPLWVLVISPFQEFFFRGWMQSQLGEVLGGWWGLVLANVCFTVWHYVSPIVDLASFPLASVGGVIATFFAGLAYGYAFHRSRNVIAPWLGHAISGLAFVLVGAMDFVQAMQ